jgi:hypothetical protein
MERRRPESISLPPMRNIFNHNTLTEGNNTRGAGDVWCSTPSNTEFLSRHYLPSPDRVPRICGKHRPHTPPSQRSGKTLHQYPSPFSDHHHAEDAEMAEARPHYLGTPSTPLFTNDEHTHIPSRRLSAVEMQRHPAPTTPKEVPLTPSIVHYRPEGVPAARSRRPSIQKSGNKKSNELKIRMSKWDRLTDKGTAPLKIEPRSATQRACTLCHFTRRKVPSSPSTASPFQSIPILLSAITYLHLQWSWSTVDCSANAQTEPVQAKPIPAQPVKNTVSFANSSPPRNSEKAPPKPPPSKV